MIELRALYKAFTRDLCVHSWDVPYLTLKINVLKCFYALSVLLLSYACYKAFFSPWLVADYIRPSLNMAGAHFIDLVCGFVFLVFAYAIAKKEYQALRISFRRMR